MATSKKDGSLEKRSKQVKTDRAIKKIVPIVMACIAVLSVLIYVVSVMYSRFGSFTVSINKYHYLEYGLSLSETKDFAHPTSALNCRADELITNIDGKELDNLDLGAIDGEDSGENYLCYTFYVKNAGKKTLSFDYSIVSTYMSMGIEKAVRIRLITAIDGVRTQNDYARAKGVDENTGEEIPEVGTIPFKSKHTIMEDTVSDFAPDKVMKITVVIWLEGPDEDCVDSVIGGEFKIDMKFNVLSA